VSHICSSPSLIDDALQDDLGWGIDRFLESLVPQAQLSAIPPISNFFVGAAALGVSGDVYMGVNIEFPGAPIGQTIHGEQCLTTLAAHNGEKGLIKLAVSAAPCGHCRQFMNETSNGGEMEIRFPEAGIEARSLTLTGYPNQEYMDPLR